MEWYVANLKLTIKNLDDNQVDFLNYAFPHKDESFISEFSYVFNNSLPGMTSSNANKVFHLLNETIYYSNNKYFVYYTDGGEGVWDCVEQEYWYNFNSYRNIRHWFIQTILDPLSISSIEYNRLILHGALWSYKGAGILILGGSGSGKSTISYLLKDDVQVLADDVLMVSSISGNMFAEAINVGFGVSKTASMKYNQIDQNNILISTKKKIYLKTLYPSNKSNNNISQDPLPIRTVLFLRKGYNEDTTIKVPSLDDALKAALNLHTNVSGQYLCKKLTMIKTLLNQCVIRFIDYPDICDIEKIKSLFKGELA